MWSLKYPDSSSLSLTVVFSDVYDGLGGRTSEAPAGGENRFERAAKSRDGCSLRPVQ
jgi:hypothetical protein